MQNDMMMGPLVPGASNNGRRIVLFIVVLAIHALLAWGFSLGLGDIVKKTIVGNLQTVEIAAPEEEEVEPPPPPPKTEAPPPFVPPPEISIETPIMENTTAIQVVTQNKPTEAPPPVAERRVVEVGPKPNPRRPLANCEEYYPSASIRAEEEGVVVVMMSVAEDGRVVDARVQEPGKFPRLDEAALKCVKTWRFLPATRDGVPVAGTLGYRVRFELKGR
jgi:periplasmic protein TonB